MSFIKFISLFLAFFQTISLTLFKQPLPQTILIDAKSTGQTFESFGTSSCWWAQTISDDFTAREIARALYDEETGLGLKVFRYNIGGGENDNPATRIGDPNRRTESFYVKNEETGEYYYDFTRDANAQRVLDYAVQYGADEIILFCNSPHFSMTQSGHASGSLSADTSNLAEENYADFVDYVLTIADYFVSKGYPVAAISPINEPQWGWGGEWVGQEGCHYSAAETVKLLELFAVTMQQRGCEYTLRGPENGQMSDVFYDYLDLFFQSEILNEYCEYYSGHAYWVDYAGDGKKQTGEYFAQQFPGKKYEMSEWCELPMTTDSFSAESAVLMANVIISDLNLMNAVSWQSWTAVNGDGLIYLENGEPEFYKRYYAFKQFSSFIEPGMQRISAYDDLEENSEISCTAFKNGEKTVIVLVNNSQSEKTVRLKGVCGKGDLYVTDSERNCEMVSQNTCFPSKISLSGQSITTAVIYN